MLPCDCCIIERIYAQLFEINSNLKSLKFEPSAQLSSNETQISDKNLGD